MSDEAPWSLPLPEGGLADIVRASSPDVVEAVTDPVSFDNATVFGTCGGKTVVAIGAFDGVHEGHRALVRAAVEDAHARGIPSAIITFDPDPDEVLRPDEISCRLTTTRQRIGLLGTLGANSIVVLRFDHRLASLPYEDFFSEKLHGLLEPVSLHVGRDFRLGYLGQGDVPSLTTLGARSGFSVTGHDLVCMGSEAVTSTRIRDVLCGGDVSRAASLLGRAHVVAGVVTHGRGEGTSFGFPTANVTVPQGICMPAEGVYAGFLLSRGVAYPAAINVGLPPSFGGRPGAPFLEANLLGFHGDLYGSEVSVGFLEYLRPSRAFRSREELEAVVLGNIDWVRTHVGDDGVEVLA